MINDKTLHIQFGSLDDLAIEIKKAMKTGKPSIFNGKSIRFESYSKFMNFMFPNKFTLLAAIKSEKPKSLYKLAQLVDRQQNSVLRDCDELAALGFIKFEAGTRNSKIPTLAFDFDTIYVHDARGIQSHQLPTAA